ncbi:MAG TPA: hypothetical protein VEK39_15155 [Solirubrobacterales bacterium]|nr:hypothetical protein [Solirubrobacterales bacterium]
MAGAGLESGAGVVAFAAVADLGDQLGGGDDRLGVAEERAEDRPVGVGVERAADLAGQQLDLLDDRLERGDEAEHDLAASLAFELAGPAGGRLAQPLQQLAGVPAAGVAVAGEEGGEPLLAQSTGVLGAGVALEKRERDGRVDFGEDPGGAPRRSRAAP